jgi:hypothetical protein
MSHHVPHSRRREDSDLASNRIPADGVRPSDREREEVAEALRRHAGEGRLDVDELGERLEAVYAARTRAELEPLTADLPGVVAPAPVPSRRRTRLHGSLIAFVAVNALLVAVWAATGAGYFWPIWPLLGWGLALLPHGRRGGFGLCHGSRRPVHSSR